MMIIAIFKALTGIMAVVSSVVFLYLVFLTYRFTKDIYRVTFEQRRAGSLKVWRWILTATALFLWTWVCADIAAGAWGILAVIFILSKAAAAVYMMSLWVTSFLPQMLTVDTVSQGLAEGNFVWHDDLQEWSKVGADQKGLFTNAEIEIRYACSYEGTRREEVVVVNAVGAHHFFMLSFTGNELAEWAQSNRKRPIPLNKLTPEQLAMARKALELARRVYKQSREALLEPEKT